MGYHPRVILDHHPTVVLRWWKLKIGEMVPIGFSALNWKNSLEAFASWQLVEFVGWQKFRKWWQAKKKITRWSSKIHHVFSKRIFFCKKASCWMLWHNPGKKNLCWRCEDQKWLKASGQYFCRLCEKHLKLCLDRFDVWSPQSQPPFLTCWFLLDDNKALLGGIPPPTMQVK